MSDASPPPLPQGESPKTPGLSPNVRVGWWIFAAALIAPALLTLLTAKSEDLWPIFTFPASGVAGLFCGFWMASRVCRTTPGKILGGLALAVIFTVISLALCFAGCAMGGAKMNFH